MIYYKPHVSVNKECELVCRPCFKVWQISKDASSFSALLSSGKKTAFEPGSLGEGVSCPEAGDDPHQRDGHAACPRQSSYVLAGVCFTAGRSLVQELLLLRLRRCSEALRQEEEFKQTYRIQVML